MVVVHVTQRSQSNRKHRIPACLSTFGFGLVAANLLWLYLVFTRGYLPSSRETAGYDFSSTHESPSQEWFINNKVELDKRDHDPVPWRIPTHRACDSDEVDGILHIQMGDIGGAAGTVFFQLILGQAIFASRNRLKPWVFLNSVSHVVYDELVHSKGEGVNLTAMVGRNATSIKRSIRVLKDVQPGPLDDSPLAKKTLHFPGTGVWEHYFEPLSDFVPGDESCKSKIYATLSLKHITPGIHKFADWAPRCWRYNNMPDYMTKPHLPISEWLEPQRKLGNEAVKKFLKPKKYILDAAESANPACSSKNACLGLHIRHSDKAEGRRQVAASEFLPYAENFIHSGGKHIYLATDSNLVIQEIESKWPEHVRSRIRSMGDQIVRSSDEQAVFDIGHHHQTNREILIEIYALSKCQLLVHGFSAVTESAIWVNMNLHLQSVNLEDPQAISPETFGVEVQMVLRGEAKGPLLANNRTDEWWKDEPDVVQTSKLSKSGTCSGFSGILRIGSVGNDQSTSGAFFNAVLNQLWFADKHNLLPWVHILPSEAQQIFDEAHIIPPVEEREIRETIIGASIGAPLQGTNRREKLTSNTIWESYFLPVSDYSYGASDPSCEDKTIFRIATDSINSIRMNATQAIRAWKYDGVAEEMWNPKQLKLKEWMAPTRKKAAYLVAKYYHLHPRITRRVDALINTKFTSLPSLAVHFRNSDKTGGNRRMVATPEFLEYILGFIEAGGGYIYVSTDSHRVLQYIDKNFPKRVRDRMRTQGKYVVRSFKHFPTNVIGDHHRVNSETLVDAVAMSRCDYMLHGYSTLAEVAIYLNPLLHENSVNLEDSGRMDAKDFKELVATAVQKRAEKQQTTEEHRVEGESPIVSKATTSENLYVISRNNKGRRNAIAYLAQKVHSSYNRDSYGSLKKSLKLLRRNYLSIDDHSATTDVFIFHTGDFNENDFVGFEEILGKDTHSIGLYLVDLSKSTFWSLPETNKNDNPETDWYAYPLFSEGYRRMMHWYAIDIWNFFQLWNKEAGCSYRYILRLDEDSFLHSPIEYDIFEFMKHGGYVYGFRMCAYEMQVTHRMWKEWGRRHANFKSERNIDLEMCGFYNNFFVADLNFFQSQPVQQFLGFIDRQGHIYRRRLGDLMIHSMVAYGFAKSAQIHRFLDFTYEHTTYNSTSACPEWGGIQAGYQDPNAANVLDNYYRQHVLANGCKTRASFLASQDLSPSYSHLSGSEERHVSLYTITAGRVEVPGKAVSRHRGMSPAGVLPSIRHSANTKTQVTMSEEDDDRAIKRVRSGSDNRTIGTVCSVRSTVEEKHVDGQRRVSELGTSFVDNGAKISNALADAVSSKAFMLVISLQSPETGEDFDPGYGQVGLIRHERLAESPPPSKKQDTLRIAHFAAVPTTNVHNVARTVVDDEVIEYVSSKIVSPGGILVTTNNFEKAGFRLSLSEDDAVVIRSSDEEGNDGFKWRYGHDLTTAGKIDNPSSHFTKKEITFVKMVRPTRISRHPDKFCVWVSGELTH